MKKITAAFTSLFALAVAGCSLFGSGEAVKQDSGRAVYRASEAPPDLSDAVQELSIPAEKSATGNRRRTAESAIRAFFGSNALVAIVVLTLITIFLFREGSGFFGQNLANLRLYRQAGLEYVDIIRTQAEKRTALSRQLGDIRLQQMQVGSACHNLLAKMRSLSSQARPNFCVMLSLTCCALGSR